MTMLYHTAEYIPTTFMVIGAGGTGSRLVPLLCQFIRTLSWVLNPKILIFDGDVVEERNLVRQNFISKDVGQNKATVLSGRYSKHFGINVHGFPFDFNLESLAKNRASFDQTTVPENLTNIVVFMCVDSVKARKEVLEAMLARLPLYDSTVGCSNCLVLDAGNEDDFGQVQIFNMDMLGTLNGVYLHNLDLPNGKIPIDYKLPFIPVNLGFYSSLEEGKATGGCADLDQTLAINTQMAVGMLTILQNFVYDKRLLYHRLNVSLIEGAQPEYMTAKWLIDREKEGAEFILKVSSIGLDSVDPPLKGYADWTQWAKLQRASTTERLSLSLRAQLNKEGFPQPKSVRKSVRTTPAQVADAGAEAAQILAQEAGSRPPSFNSAFAIPVAVQPSQYIVNISTTT